MNADLSPALEASNTVETLAATVMDKIEAEAAKIEDSIEAAAPAAVEKIEAVGQEVVAEVKKIVAAVEKTFAPENAARPVLNHTVLTSQIRNPA